jgi:hypothetical protein
MSSCPAGKIINPKTRRCVSITGKIGREILAQSQKTPTVTVSTPTPVAKKTGPQSPKKTPKPAAKKASPKPAAKKASPKPAAKKASPKPAAKAAASGSCVQYTQTNTTASQYKKYSTRASPPYPANECPEGMVQQGNDGNNYVVSAPNAKNIKRWQKVKQTGGLW